MPLIPKFRTKALLKQSKNLYNRTPANNPKTLDDSVFKAEPDKKKECPPLFSKFRTKALLKRSINLYNRTLATEPQTLNDSVFKAKPDNKEGTLATAPIILNDSVLKNEYIKKKPIYKKQEGLPSLADLL